MSQFGGRYDDTPKAYFSPTDVNKPRPRLKKYERTDEEGNKEFSHYDFITGILYKIETEEFEYEGNKLTKIRYYLTDEKAEAAAVFTASMHTNYNRDFLNRLSNLESIGDVKFLLWNSYWEEKDKNITRGSIQIQDENGNYQKVECRYPHEDIPKVEYVEVGDKTVPNDKEIKEFFNKVLNDMIIPKLKFGSIKEIKNHFSPSKSSNNPPKDFDPDDIEDGFEPEAASVEEEDEVPF